MSEIAVDKQVFLYYYVLHNMILNTSHTLLTYETLSTRWGIPVGTLRVWVHLQKIPCVRLGRCVRFRPDDIIKIENEGFKLAENI